MAAAVLGLPLTAGASGLSLPAATCGVRGTVADSACAILGGEALRTSWSILAVSLDRGDTLIALTPERRLEPGSNLKLFTTGAFLRRFGPNSRRSTLLYAQGRVERGDGGREIRFKGDLVLRGSGMPDVAQLLSPGSRGLLDSLAALLSASGLRRFDGTLWIDGSLFARAGYPRGWAIEDLALGYGAPLNPILANGNAATIIATGERSGATLSLEPPDAPVLLSGTVVLGDSGTTGHLSLSREPFSTVVHVSGMAPRGGTVRRSVAIFEPDSAAGLLLVGAMRRAGIEVDAAVRLWARGLRDAPGLPSPAGSDSSAAAAMPPAWNAVGSRVATPLLALPSPPARAVVQAVDAWSLNIESEALLRLLDPAPEGKAPERALRELRASVVAAGVDSADVSFVDGSGLSPQNLVTARAVVTWLAAMDRGASPGARLSDLLATPGTPGTMERRLVSAGADSTIRVKTGTLTNVSALSGYLTTRGGDRVAFSILSNGNRGSVAAARSVEEALVSLLSRSTNRPPEARRRVLGIPR
jgi:D-alanyl-D-alanine carboxypeptidase/D-alanyl-D-alanine-endopeptidase (penicillin-binding protein 4)